MKAIRIRSQDEFDALLSSIANDTVTASIHWRLHQQLWSARLEWQSEMAQAWTFWSLTITAHYEVALFRLARLYDQHKAALSLPRLLATVEANLEVFDEAHFRERLRHNPFVDSLATGARKPDIQTLAADMVLAGGADPLVQKLVAARDGALAHQDPRVPLGTLDSPAHALTAADLQELLDRAVHIANRYTILFRATSYSTRIVGEADFMTLLEYVRNGLADHEHEIQEQLAKLGTGGAG